MPGDCDICFQEYDTAERLPKITDCGHTYCLECLQKAMQNGMKCCPNCRKPFEKNPTQLTTNFALLREDSDNQLRCLYCNDCKKIAVSQCHSECHPVLPLQQKIESTREDLKKYKGIIESITPCLLRMQDISTQQLNAIMSEGDKCKKLSEDLSVYAQDGSQLQDTICQVEEFTKRQPLVDHTSQLCTMREGTVSFEFQCLGGGDGPSHYVAKIDLRAMTTESPEVLAATQVLMHLLSKHGHLRSRQERVPMPEVVRRTPTARGAKQAQMPSRFQQSQRACSSKASPTQSVVEITNDGVLDLGAPSCIGTASFGEQTSEKQYLLASGKLVKEIKGLECAADPQFSKQLLLKHQLSLESVDLRKVQSDHFNLLSAMPKIKNIKVVNYDGRLADFPPQPAGRALKSLYMHLPLFVQLSMWKAFASSLQTVTMRVEVAGTVDVHTSIRPCAEISPKLNNLQLHRKDPSKHTPADCAKQVGRVQQVVANSVCVTCNMCRHQLS